MTAALQALKKITVAAINGKRGGFEVKEGDKDRVVGRIYGRADSVEPKSTGYGPYLEFKGQFRAENADRAQSFAPKMILPSPADSMLAEAIAADESKMGVTFAFDIVLRPIAKRSPIDRGYEFVVIAHQQGAAVDPFAALAASLPKLEALPAPTQQELPVEQPAEEKAPAKPTKK